MKRMLSCLTMLFFVSCVQRGAKEAPVLKKTYADITNDNDTLFSTSHGKFDYGASCGYVNLKGDTIIPPGTFNMCYTDTFATYAYVYDKRRYGKGMVAINRNQEVIFDTYLFDNGPDYISDGLFRVERNGKIGYADVSGKVVIEAKYTCAYPFENGRAKVAYDCEIIRDDLEHTSWESESWFYIDKKGDKIK